MQIDHRTLASKSAQNHFCDFFLTKHLPTMNAIHTEANDEQKSEGESDEHESEVTWKKLTMELT